MEKTTQRTDAPVIEDTFILADQSYIYTEQDWSANPEAADAATFETRNAYWHYMAGLLGSKPIIESGRQLRADELRHRAIELAGGLFLLAPHASTTFPLARRFVASLLIMGGMSIPHDLL